ncbi:ATP-binding protein, partial [[Clostridium] scindens]|uniref:ATP-binding protein n=1 Tax=Clostridium scindens (strain JCM 10418 / VPI 12708) TaxID=29347 RepID=UPI0034A35116
MHREYGASASTLISIYTDRIEFTSIGGLVTDITLADIMMGVSVCRNARLANVFYRLELIEAYGTGIQKIFKSYEDTSKKPRIETSDNAFKVTLPNLNVKNDDLKQLTHIQSDQDKVIDLALKQGFVTRKNIEKLLSIG